MEKSLFLTACILGPSVVPLVEKGSADREARAIIEKAIKAHGGADQVAKLKKVNIKVKGTHSVPGFGELRFMLEDVWDLPDRYRTSMRTEVGGMPFTQIRVVDRDKGWMRMNDQTMDLAKEALEEMKEQIYAESLDKLFPILKGKFDLSVLKEVEVTGSPAVGVKISSGGHKDVELYFDKASGLVVKRVHKVLGGLGKEVLQEVVFSDYKEVDGLQHWMKIAAYQEGKEVLEGEVTEVKFLKQVDESLFKRN